MTIQGIGVNNLAQVGSVGASAGPSSCGEAGGGGEQAGASLSGPGQFFSQLQALEKSDPAKAGQVLGDIASKLRDRASKATGIQAASLSELADKFQQAAKTGDLSVLQSGGTSGAHGGHGAHGHHGHHKAHRAYENGQGNSLLDLMDSVLAADTGAPTTSTATAATVA
jgi:hypothetical protein